MILLALVYIANFECQNCNMQVDQTFFFQGNDMHKSAALLRHLLNDRIDLLMYAGNADGMRNYMVSILLSP